MTGAYMTWTYGPAGWIFDLNDWIKDPAKDQSGTAPGTTCCPACAILDAWDGLAGGALVRATPSSGAFRGVTSRTASPTTQAMFDKAGVIPPATPRRGLVAVSAKVTRMRGGSMAPRRARLALLGDHPSGLPVCLCQFRSEGFRDGKKQAENRDEHQASKDFRDGSR